MRENALKKNIESSILLQIVTIICGFVSPKIILSCFGSNVNGLVSSVNQFLNYASLLEGGLGSVVMASLYKPLCEKNQYKLNSIINATDKFFKQLAIIYIVYALILSFVYPLQVDTGFNYLYSISLILVLASTLFVQYFFSITYRLLLSADRRVYIVNITQTILTLLNTGIVILCSRIYSDILIIKLLSAVIYIIQPVIFSICVRKYFILDKKNPCDKEALAHRWDGLGINTAFFVHANTDIVILTFFSTLLDVSIYSIYLMIVKAIKSLVVSISSAIVPSFGKILVEGKQEEINKMYDIYEFSMSIISIAAFSACMVLITPFIDVYTSNIQDANYHQVVFGILLTLSELIYCYRDPSVSTAYAGGHIKKVSKYAYIEAISNIVISLVLVSKLGLIGVAIGTCVGMIYRMIMHNMYLKNNILMRPMKKVAKNIAVFWGAGIVSVFICFSFFNMSVHGYTEWVFLAIKSCVVIGVVILVASFVFYRDLLKELLEKIFRKG